MGPTDMDDNVESGYTRARHPSKLDIGYCQKVWDIANLNPDIGCYPLKLDSLKFRYGPIGTLVSP